jgi:hypothetical protein
VHFIFVKYEIMMAGQNIRLFSTYYCQFIDSFLAVLHN